MDKDTELRITCWYSEEDGGWVAEESYTGVYAVESTPYKALFTLGMTLPDDPESTDTEKDD